MTVENLVHAMNNIEDKYIIETLPSNQLYYMNERKKNVNKLWKFAGVAGTVAVAMFLCIVAVNFVNPVVARNMPVMGGMFKYVQNNLDFPGNYNSYATELGETVKRKGVSVSLSEVYCDGINLWVSYKVYSKKPFDSYTKNTYLETQLGYTAKQSIQYSDKDIELEDLGTTGLEGKFVDENTFVGVEEYSLKGREFPDNFVYDIQIESFNLIQEEYHQGQTVSGNWRFKVPVQVNKDGVRTIEVNASKDGYTIDRIVVAPVKTTIYTSFPRMVNWEGIRYAIFFYSDLSKNEVVGEGTYDVEKGKGVSQISSDKIGKTLDVYVADFDTLDKAGAKYTRENLEKYAILHEKIDLQ